jgi:hypothetical protein
MIRVLVCLAAAGVLGLSTAAAQTPFVELTPTGSSLFSTDEATDFWVNAVAAADVDGDGDLDLAVLGFYVVYFESVEDILVIFRNDGPGPDGRWLFTEQRVPLGGVTAGASDLAWGDYDRDGDPDLAVGSNGATVLFRNDGGTLVAAGVTLPGYYEDSEYTGAYDLRSITWVDVDNDGDLDLLVPSVFNEESFAFSTRLLRNDGADDNGGWIFTDLAAALDPTVHAQSAWADDDGDGDLDLLLVNIDPYTETGFIRRYRNDGGTFTGQDLLGIQIQWGSADWGDYDADGDLDLLVAGNIREAEDTYTTVLRVYRNDGGGTYTPITLAEGWGDWLDLHAATWADYDSDGDMDLLVTGNFIGETEIEGKSEIYVNDGGVFTRSGTVLPAPESSIGRGGTFTWLDLDNDGDLDYFVAGSYYVPNGNGLVEAQMHLYRNDAPIVNRAPASPGNAAAAPSGNAVTLSWDVPADDGTPGKALTYDLHVVPSGGGGRLAVERKRLAEPGGLSAATRWTLRGLAPGTYDWTVRAVDSAFNGGAPAGGSFVIEGAVDEPVGGAVTGQTVRRVQCFNLTTGARVSTQADGAGAWDCEAAGLAVAPGHRVKTLVVGRANGTPPFGGTATGQDLVTATCRNVTTRLEVKIPLGGATTSWNCEAAGLVVNPGDTVRTILRAKAR